MSHDNYATARAGMMVSTAINKQTEALIEMFDSFNSKLDKILEAIK